MKRNISSTIKPLQSEDSSKCVFKCFSVKKGQFVPGGEHYDYNRSFGLQNLCMGRCWPVLETPVTLCQFVYITKNCQKQFSSISFPIVQTS